MSKRITSDDDREQIISKFRNNDNFIAYPKLLDISKHTAYRIERAYTKDNRVKKLKSNGRPTKIFTEMSTILIDLIKREPLLTLSQMKAKAAEIYIRFQHISITAIHRNLNKKIKSP